MHDIVKCGISINDELFNYSHTWHSTYFNIPLMRRVNRKSSAGDVYIVANGKKVEIGKKWEKKISKERPGRKRKFHNL